MNQLLLVTFVLDRIKGSNINRNLRLQREMAAIIITTTSVVVLFISAVIPLPDSERSLTIVNSEFYCPLLNFEKHSLCYDSRPDVVGVSNTCAGCALECFSLKTCIFFQWIVSRNSFKCQLFYREPQNKGIEEKEICSSYALVSMLLRALFVSCKSFRCLWCLKMKVSCTTVN